MSRGTCRACEHSRMTTQLGLTGLYCHADTPKVFMFPTGVGQVQIGGLWPPVEDSSSCAQFKPDPDARNEPRPIRGVIGDALL